MDLVAGQLLGRYEIKSHLGTGGMGVVYRARDTELGRDVAIKVLNAQSAGSQSRIDRFAREARAVARLSHPNILDIHDFGIDEGITYAVTELLRGSTLHQRLRKGAIPVQKGLEICSAIAEGLAAAHGEGIIHRDVKPSNIFLTDTGQVKILDFGIARLRERPVDEAGVESEVPTETSGRTSQMAGTVGYMAPEQIEGREIDGRSDIFALGCVMYEVLSGRRAFREETVSETMLAILGKDTDPIRSFRPEVRPTVELIVRRCLEKLPGERFESARDVAFAIQAIIGGNHSDSDVGVRPPVRTWWQKIARPVTIATIFVLVTAVCALFYLKYRPGTAQLPAKIQLAVIDFTAPEGDAVLGDLAAGLTETVSNDLRLLERQTHGAIWVVPRRYRRPDSPWTLESVAHEHGITLGLEGRLRSRGDRLQLDLGLRVPGSSTPLRTVVIEEDFDNLTSFQEAPLMAVATLLGVEPDSETIDKLHASSTFVVPAFASYLSGVGRLVRSQDGPSTQEAYDLIARASDLDPTSEPFHEWMLRACALLIQESGGADSTAGCDARDLEQENQNEAGVLAAMAAVYRARGDVGLASQLMRDAVSIRPDDGELLLQLGRDQLILEDLEEAESSFHRAIDLRPGYWEGHHYLGVVDYVRGNYEATANAWRVAAHCAPQSSNIYSNLGAVFHVLDRRDEARRVLEIAVELPDDPDYVTLSNLGTLYFEDAYFAEAAEKFESALAIDDSDYRVWGHLAWSYASSFDSARAAEPFQRAVALAEKALEESPDDSALLARLAGYYGMLGRNELALETVERAVRLDPQDPTVIATVGESLEDLGDRERSLEWIGRALSLGVPRTRFERRPSLRDLVADKRYQSLIQDLGSNGNPGLS